MKHLLLGIAAAVSLATAASAATIDTLAGQNSAISSWGLPNTASYGQTFTLDTDASLTDVLFRINDYGNAVSYDLHVLAWDGTRASGSSLGSVSGTTAGVVGMRDVSIATGGFTLGAGSYVAFLQATSRGMTSWGSVAMSDAYSGGEFVFQNNGGDTSLWTTTDWRGDWQGANSDLAFRIDYEEIAPIPVAPALPLLATGLAALVLLRRRAKA